MNQRQPVDALVIVLGGERLYVRRQLVWTNLLPVLVGAIGAHLGGWVRPRLWAATLRGLGPFCAD